MLYYFFLLLQTKLDSELARSIKLSTTFNHTLPKGLIVYIICLGCLADVAKLPRKKVS